ncbi:hypothetical protein GCM10027413_10800 [Conyzicola nivalis]|uniref:Uncharacterized protein n=1 Tax=Conyzicola nivalis TaxID=1477021 RepID=A0A916WJ28_9MICO|nr:hypothetical protein GCM10010979_15830 [Conyzicola nivalis]
MSGFGATLLLFGCIQLAIQMVSKGTERRRERRSSGAATSRPFWLDPVFWAPPATFWAAGLLTIAISFTIAAYR